MPESHLLIFPTLGAMSQAAVDLFIQAAGEAVKKRGRFLAVLSGGNTPVPFFRLLAQPANRNKLPWELMYFFWADERCVPPEHLESNYGLARLKFLAYVPIPQTNLHRIKGELPVREALKDYQKQLLSFAEPGLKWPRFDFVLLGLGADGHTASLFPGMSFGEKSADPVISAKVQYQDRPAERISLTETIFNTSRLVLFLVSGEEKAEALAATRRGKMDPSRWPAQRVRPDQGKVWWYVDASAASFLSEDTNKHEMDYMR